MAFTVSLRAAKCRAFLSICCAVEQLSAASSFRSVFRYLRSSQWVRKSCWTSLRNEAEAASVARQCSKRTFWMPPGLSMSGWWDEFNTVMQGTSNPGKMHLDVVGPLPDLSLLAGNLLARAFRMYLSKASLYVGDCVGGGCWSVVMPRQAGVCNAVAVVSRVLQGVSPEATLSSVWRSENLLSVAVLGGPAQDLPKFQIPSLTPKSVQTCSIHSPDGDSKVSLKKITSS